jgi:prepilin-type processing-associated H-X9-DG protein
MNIDLKREANGLTPIPYLNGPNMPKMTAFKQPTATVFMFDCVFDPISEVVNDAPQYNSVNPANRQNSFASRHSQGGVINFLDGHVNYFKLSYIQTTPPLVVNRNQFCQTSSGMRLTAGLNKKRLPFQGMPP